MDRQMGQTSAPMTSLCLVSVCSPISPPGWPGDTWRAVTAFFIFLSIIQMFSESSLLSNTCQALFWGLRIQRRRRHTKVLPQELPGTEGGDRGVLGG